MDSRIIQTLLLVLVWPLSATAGSVGGARAGGSSLGLDCDKRERFINCTELEKNHVLDKCYVVVHEQKRSDCTWQSCGFVSVVQKRPKVSGSELDEYGIKTNISQYQSAGGEVPAGWNRNGSGFAPGEVTPKSPFPRHYLTVKEALALRKVPDGSAVSDKIKSIPQEVLDSNPYLECASRTGSNGDEVYVMLHKGTLSSSSEVLAVKVQKKDVSDACSKLKLMESSGSCVIGTSSIRPHESVPIATFLSQNPVGFSASPSAPAAAPAPKPAIVTVPCDSETESRIRYEALQVAKGKTCKSETQKRSRTCTSTNGVKSYSAWSSWSPWNYSLTSCSVKK
ncbi:MAG: hypothetical protein EBR09_09450 [Proteobacteria bacterium]|nr:hypothetical protein [Pseudomonadota bacterium]